MTDEEKKAWEEHVDGHRKSLAGHHFYASSRAVLAAAAELTRLREERDRLAGDNKLLELYLSNTRRDADVLRSEVILYRRDAPPNVSISVQEQLRARDAGKEGGGMMNDEESVNGKCCSCGYDGEEETECPIQEDRVHCVHWWEGPDDQ